MAAATSTVLFAGGGTAGHLFPGIAVAEELARLVPPIASAFVGTGTALEREQVTRRGYGYQAVASQPTPRAAGEVLPFVFKNFEGYRAAARALRELQPAIVVGLGGFASAGTARAAITLGIPLVLLEQNAIPGRVTRLLAPRAAMVCLGMAESRAAIRSRGLVRVTGTPVRASIIAPAHGKAASDEAQRRAILLVLGGSNGAAPLNDAVPKALYRLRRQLPDWQVIHQTGIDPADRAAKLYGRLDIKARVIPFVDPIGPLLRRAALVVSRAGGSTLAELAATGVPAVLVPYAHAADDHQRRNAEVFRQAGACEVADRQDASERLDAHIARAVGGILDDRGRRDRMAAAALQLARPAAAWHVAHAIRALAVHSPLGRVA